MSSTLRHIIITVVLLVTAVAAMGQRRVTPVEPSGKPATEQQKEDKPDPSRLAHRQDADGKVILVDTVTGLEYVDSTLLAKPPKMIYPLMYRITGGVNVWNLAMRLLGQSYGLGGVWVEANLHNRYFPYLEVGLGSAAITPEGLNYSYHSATAPYFKIGASYNIFYNSNSDYQFLVGLRYGFTPFNFSVDDVTINDSYWGETSELNIPSQHATAGYLDLALGVKVKIVGNFWLGWTFIYHHLIHESKCLYGEPMYIPGFGKRGTKFTADFSVMWNFDVNKRPSPAVDTKDK